MKTFNDFLKKNGGEVDFDERGRIAISFPSYNAYLSAKDELRENDAFGKSVSAFHSDEFKIFLR